MQCRAHVHPDHLFNRKTFHLVLQYFPIFTIGVVLHTEFWLDCSPGAPSVALLDCRFMQLYIVPPMWHYFSSLAVGLAFIGALPFHRAALSRTLLSLVTSCCSFHRARRRPLEMPGEPQLPFELFFITQNMLIVILLYMLYIVESMSRRSFLDVKLQLHDHPILYYK